MNGAEVLDVGRDALWLTIQLCAPVLLVGLVEHALANEIGRYTGVAEQGWFEGALLSARTAVDRLHQTLSQTPAQTEPAP